MPDKSNFTPDEWKLLLESVMTAGIAISAAEPSGVSGPSGTPTRGLRILVRTR
jgi:hypothetical protein